MVRGLEGETLKDEGQEVLRRRNMGLRTKCEDLCAHVNVHQRALAMEEALHGQVNAVLVRWAGAQSDHGGRERGSA